MKKGITRVGLGALVLAASACYGGDTNDGGGTPELNGGEPVGAAQEAISRFALVCIKNTTGRSINYDIKWGDGAWSTYSVEGSAGANRWHSMAYTTPGSTHSPPLRIRFDSDMTSGTSYVEYNLKKYAAAEQVCNLGKQYQFEWDGTSMRYIDLKSID